MHVVKVEDAVGKVLLHDITRIVPGTEKGPAFRKGHIIRDEDIERLKDLGKESIYVFEISPDQYHEDEAGDLMKSIAGDNVSTTGPVEGKIQFIADTDGLVKIDKGSVHRINALGEIAVTTLHSHIPVKKGDKLAGARVIPLTIEKIKVDTAVGIGREPVISVAPFIGKTAALIVTALVVGGGSKLIYQVFGKR